MDHGNENFNEIKKVYGTDVKFPEKKVNLNKKRKNLLVLISNNMIILLNLVIQIKEDLKELLINFLNIWKILLKKLKEFQFLKIKKKLLSFI